MTQGELSSTTMHAHNLVKCSLRHSANSKRIGIIIKLRKAFEEVGRRGPFEKHAMSGDPTKSLLVQEDITYKQMEQGLSGHKKREAPTMARPKMDRLMRNMELHTCEASKRHCQAQASRKKSHLCFLLHCHKKISWSR